MDPLSTRLTITPQGRGSEGVTCLGPLSASMYVCVYNTYIHTLIYVSACMYVYVSTEGIIAPM